MNKPDFSVPQLPPASEYALILGAGASAAVSIAAQHVAMASLPVTTLVAIGLLNRHRLDQRLKQGESVGYHPEETSERPNALSPQQVSARPGLLGVSAQPQPGDRTAPMPVARFSRRSPDASERLTALQQASLQQIGARLQQQRQERTLSLDDIHNHTRIQLYTLRAIETGDLKSLPEPFYVRAFIQKYASFLGLPGEAVAADFPMG